MTLPGHEPDPYAAQAGEIDMSIELELRMAEQVVAYIQETAIHQNVNVAKVLAFINARLMHATEPELHVDGVEFGAELREQMEGAGK